MIEILLATYNGERFLAEQIESILSQSCNDFKISVSDDGSEDYTLEILRSYENTLGNKMKVTVGKSQSAKENFYNLLDNADSDYIALSDQDDYWDKDRLLKGIRAIKIFENKYGSDMPVLIHSDLEITDENLIHRGRMRDANGIKSFLKNAVKIQNNKNLYKINNAKNLSRLLVENNITGNTVMFNRALLNLYKRPVDSFMHDWWLGILAYTLGKVGYIDEELVKYRQHGDNVLGGKKPSLSLKERIENRARIRKNYDAMFNQAEEFLKLYKNELINAGDTEVTRILKSFCDMKNKNRVLKIIDIFRYGFVKSSLILTIGEMFNI